MPNLGEAFVNLYCTARGEADDTSFIPLHSIAAAKKWDPDALAWIDSPVPSGSWDGLSALGAGIFRPISLGGSISDDASKALTAITPRGASTMNSGRYFYVSGESTLLYSVSAQKKAGASGNFTPWLLALRDPESDSFVADVEEAAQPLFVGETRSPHLYAKFTSASEVANFVKSRLEETKARFSPCGDPEAPKKRARKEAPGSNSSAKRGPAPRDLSRELPAVASHPLLALTRSVQNISPQGQNFLKGLNQSARNLLDPNEGMQPLGHPNRPLAIAALAHALVEESKRPPPAAEGGSAATAIPIPLSAAAATAGLEEQSP